METDIHVGWATLDEDDEERHVERNSEKDGHECTSSRTFEMLTGYRHRERLIPAKITKSS